MKLNDKEAESKARSEAALQALHDENKRLGLYDYEIGFIDGKASAKREFDALFAEHQKLLGELQAMRNVKRQWVGLTDAELAEFSDAKLGSYDLCLEVEAKLKEKNT